MNCRKKFFVKSEMSGISDLKNAITASKTKAACNGTCGICKNSMGEINDAISIILFDRKNNGRTVWRNGNGSFESLFFIDSMPVLINGNKFPDTVRRKDFGGFKRGAVADHH